MHCMRLSHLNPCAITANTMSRLLSMFLALLATVLLLGVSTADANKGTAKTSPVLELTSGNFTSAVAHGTSMVMFYSPWCPHCRRSGPAFRNFARKTKNLQKEWDFKIFQLNCEAFESTCDTHQIEGYPTFLVFQNGNVLFEYDGELDSDSLTEFAKRAAANKFVFDEKVLEKVPADDHRGEL
ncbi:thioredoxin-like protein [Catenaria anguillulae PL171]|uniref:Thioredoxin-like protein n=1 Tax=Catenaria anguillulae PL171 TaxID=765915 RepID=A0A1Y2HIH2_9FUNG|nr:thioredoxin-like protein [Catenaria anguillulae PL171]